MGGVLDGKVAIVTGASRGIGAEIARRFGQAGAADILVSNAAVTWFTPVMDFSAKRYRLMFAVQVEAPFHLAQLVTPGLRAKGRGWILNISSVAARPPAFPPTSGPARVSAPCTGCARPRWTGSRPGWRPSSTTTT